MPAPAAAQGAGSSATTLLRVSPGPRPLALADAVSAVPGPDAVEYNPAAITGPLEIAAGYQMLPTDVGAGSARIVGSRGRVSVGLSLRFLDYGTVEVVERRSGGLPVGDPTGERVGGGEVSALAAASVGVGPLRFGVAGRWLRQEVVSLSDDVVSADAGVLLRVTRGIHVGAAVQHLGPDLEAGRPAPLPRTVRLGASWQTTAAGLDWLVTAEGRTREERTGGGVGLEVTRGWEDGSASLRLGWEARPEEGDAFSPLVVGGGVQLGPLGVELGWRSIGPLGDTRQLGIRYRF